MRSLSFLLLLLRRGLDLNPKVLFLKLAQGSYRRLKDQFDRVFSKYFYSPPTFKSDVQLQRLFLNPLKLKAESLPSGIFKANERFLKHEFDILGSGWVRSSLSVNELKNQLDKRPAAYRAHLLKRSEYLFKSDYQPIDWHRDLTSQFRFDESLWWSQIRFGHIEGVEVKAPWDLARCQHLVSFALEAQAASENRKKLLFNECLMQWLDFSIQNPVGFGVNWRCPMDVAIRAANWILAFDLFSEAGSKLDQEQQNLFISDLLEHGRFIKTHLEKTVDFRGNHYLANLCGLAFIGAVLPDSFVEKKAWLEFSAKELGTEIKHQYLADGTYFEASTSYHRLASEMYFYTAALLNGRKMFALDFSLIAAIGGFMKAVTRPSGAMTQIGDADSGHFFKIPFRLRNNTLLEDHLGTSDLIEASEFFLKNEIKGAASAVLSALLPFDFRANGKSTLAESKMPELKPKTLALNSIPDKVKKTYRFGLENLNSSALEFMHYPDFGVFIAKTENFYLSFRCGPLGQHGRAGHDHLDQLSIELESNSKALIRDPGSYSYTSRPKARNQYRSFSAHFTPQITEHLELPYDLNSGLFYIRGARPGEFLGFEKTLGGFKVLGRRPARNSSYLYRLIELANSELTVYDWLEAESYDSNGEMIDLLQQKPLPFSPGYGELETRLH